MFADFGFQEVYSLDGGFEAWSNAQTGACIRPLSLRLTNWLAAQGFPKDRLNAKGAQGLTPLMRAALKGELGLAKEILSAGAAPDTTNDDGNNALWLNCVGGNLEVLDLLIRAGTPLDHQNDTGALASYMPPLPAKRTCWKNCCRPVPTHPVHPGRLHSPGYGRQPALPAAAEAGHRQAAAAS